VPEGVDRVVERALHPDASLRYPDLGSFWQALEAAMAAAGEPALRPSGITGPGGSFPTGPRPDIESAPTVQVSGPFGAVTTQPSASITQQAATTLQSGAAPPNRGPWIALASLVIAMAALGVAFGGKLMHGQHQGAPSASAPVASVEAPVSQNPAAAALYREAMQAWHDGSQDRAMREMERAVGLDREIGAGHLRLALWYMMLGNAGGKLAEAREHYQKALLHRAALGEADKELVQAAEPYLRQPWDLDDWGKRVEELSARFPDNLEIMVYVGSSYLARFQPDPAIAAYEKALAKDPGLLAARVAEADSLSMKGDPEGQLKAYDACLKALPVATQCLTRRLTLQAQLGHCAAMRDDAQRLHSIDAKSAVAERNLALALHASGSSPESVTEALKRSWALQEGADKGRMELEDEAALAAISGDFTGSQRHIEAWQTAVADKPDQMAHAMPAQRLAEVFAEIGQPKKASDAAGAYVRRMNAWTEPTSGGWLVLFLAYQLRAGALHRPDFEAQRAKAVESFRAKWQSAGRKIDEDFAWMSWSFTYGAAVATEEEARAAVEAMPKQKSRAVERGRSQNIDLYTGRAYALAGAHAAAIPPLRRITDGCLALNDPVSRTQALFYLGLALEGSGDFEGARAAYRKLIDRWGKATPASQTAGKARARLLAIANKK
jgi:tetratricopeptide (TPR) repeat protein